MQDCQRHSFLPHEKPADQMVMSPPLKLTSSHHPYDGEPSMFRYMCTTTTLEEPTWKAGENKEAPQSAKCLPLAQHQTGKTPLGWVNSKLVSSTHS